MIFRYSSSWTKPAIRVAAAGLGTAVAGPLGGAIGGWLGVTLGGSAADLVEKYAEKFGDNAAEKLLDLGADSLLEKLKESAPDLESVYRDALRQSLAGVRADMTDGFDDWFANWNFCLAASIPLNLPPTNPSQLVPEKLNNLFLHLLERLDAQGAAMRLENLSLKLEYRAVPEALLSELNSRLPEHLEKNIHAILVKPEYEEGWKQAQLIFQRYANEALDRIDETTKRIDHKTDVLPEMADNIARLLEIAEAGPRSFQSNPLPELREHFLGREEESKLILDRVRAHRVVTITGLGGIGKSEISKAVGRAANGQEWAADGVFYVDVQAAMNASLVRDAIILNLMLDPNKPIPNQLARRCLYVLDDLYQAVVGDLQAVQGFVQSLYDSAAPAHFLLTSRERIGVPGVENCYPLGRLLPPHDAQLFRSVVDGFGHNWQVGDTERASSLLQQLDGYPLAIIIAANRLSDLSLETLLRRWENRHTEALNLPGISPDELSKMTSVDFSLTLSFNHLPDGEVRALFALFADLPGGAKDETLEALAGDEVHDLLAYLVRASLVQRQDDRYSVLVPVREFASKRRTHSSSKLTQKLDAHLIAFAEHWCCSTLFWNTPKKYEAIAVLANEKPNLFAAISRARVRNDDDLLARIISALSRFLALVMNDSDESTELLLAGVAAAQHIRRPHLEANCLFGLAYIHGMLDDELETARECYEKALGLYQSVGDRFGEASCTEGLGDLEKQTDQPEAARRRYDEAVLLYREQRESLGVANCLRKIAALEEDPQQSLKYFEAALALFRTIGDELGEGNCLAAMAELQLGEQNPEEARKLIYLAFPALENTQNKRQKGNCLLLLGNVCVMDGDYENAQEHFAQASQIFAGMEGHRAQGFCLASLDNLGEVGFVLIEAGWLRAECVRRLGDVLMLMNKPEEATRSYLDALPLFEHSLFRRVGEVHCRKMLGLLLWQKKDYSRALEHFDKAIDLSPIDPLEAAGVLYDSGQVLLDLEQHEQARSRFEHALHLFTDNGNNLGRAECLAQLGYLLSLNHQYDKAIQTYNEALVLYEGTGPSAELAVVYWNIAEAHNEERRTGDAIGYMQTASEISELAGDVDQAEGARSKIKEWSL